jgi:hypothetical protein
MRKPALPLVFALLWSALAFSQGLSSLSGTVADPSGAVIPNATITIENSANNVKRDTVSDSQGRYSFAQVQPGTYRLTAKSPGFADVAVNEIRLLVNTPSTLNVTFEKVGAVATTVEVSGTSTLVNTQDASLGNAIGDKPITQLPFEARNVVGLLSLQPGVTYIGENVPGLQSDYRNGTVNGGKSEQANVTLDGVDVNDQQNRTAFTSVLRVTLDSVQEFRTITTNAGAEYGRTSGAQVNLVTKAGTNDIHGSVYWFLRNTATSANNFFNNSAGVDREKLNRNIGGVSLGGPIKKNKLFYFLNYEGRRDRSETSVVRTVPNESFRNGIFTYNRRGGGRGTLGPADFKRLDPLGIGQNQAVLNLLKSYPLPNDATQGDGLNTSGYRFNGSAPLNFNTYIAKFDYIIDSAQKHNLFFRGNLQNDNFVPPESSSLAQLPGEPGNRTVLDNSKGLAIGYTGVWSPTFVSTTRYGLTRQGTDRLGILFANQVSLRDIDDRYGTTTSLKTIIPVHSFTQDFSWTKGAHSVAFGGVVRIIRNQRSDFANSYSFGLANANYLLGSGDEFVVPDASGGNAYKRQFANMLGLVTEITANYNYDLTGNVLPQGSGVNRTFGAEEYEMYLQDTWKVTRALTITAGLRYSLMPPVYETNGYQTTSTIPLGDWFDQRGGLADQGKSQEGAGRISFVRKSDPGGRDLYPFHKNLVAPRFAIAYSPQGDSGLSKLLFGGPGKTSIRAGFGMFYDLIGQGLIRNYTNSALGFTTQLQPPPTYSASNAPRYQGFFNLPSSALPPAPKGGFPVEQPDLFQITNAIDDRLDAPYSMNLNFSVGREFGRGWFVQGSYVGRLMRHTLVRSDVAMPTNLRDPASGQTYFEAATQLAKLGRAGTPINNVAKIPFWENMWPGAATSTLTATQSIYRLYRNNPDYTTALVNIDLNCEPACSRLGPSAIFNSQFSSLGVQRSIGAGNYHGMQWTVRKRFGDSLTMDANYTWSKTIDLDSAREVGTGTGTNIINAWRPSDMRAVADYDQTHVFSAFAVWELPFGKGKRWGSNAGRGLDSLVGGWQISGIWRQSSGLPWGAAAYGVWPTNWNSSSYAIQVAPLRGVGTSKNAPSADGESAGGPNAFRDPAAALAAYDYAYPGDSGQRNGIRGDGYFSIDVGVAKRFRLFSIRDNPHTLQLRAEAFNVTNSVNFDVYTMNVDITSPATFGKYTSILGNPRVFQFGLRYEF